MFFELPEQVCGIHRDEECRRVSAKEIHTTEKKHEVVHTPMGGWRVLREPGAAAVVEVRLLIN